MTEKSLPPAPPSSEFISPIQDILNKVTAHKNPSQKMLGISKSRTHYDLAFEADGNAKFLIILSALMGFLAIMALSGGMAIGNITKGWASDLQNTMTIEVPAYDSQGIERKNNDIIEMQSIIQSRLHALPYIEKVRPLKREDVYNLVKTWLGDGNEDETIGEDNEGSDESTIAAGFPLPGLISVTLAKNTDSAGADKNIGEITKILNDIDSSLSIDTHEEWLGDIVRISRILQFCAIVIAGIVMIITVIAIAGGVKSRMEIYHKDIELLHLMGAQDEYIAKQFQRHALSITLKGVSAGLISALIMIFAFHFISTQHNATLPDAGLSALEYICLGILSAFMCGVSAFIARYTVLRNLQYMP